MSEDDELVLQTVQENVTVGARNLTDNQGIESSIPINPTNLFKALK